jgi:hypoxanthine-guanine phosphoribosyltransferase
MLEPTELIVGDSFLRDRGVKMSQKSIQIDGSEYKLHYLAEWEPVGKYAKLRFLQDKRQGLYHEMVPEEFVDEKIEEERNAYKSVESATLLPEFQELVEDEEYDAIAVAPSSEPFAETYAERVKQFGEHFLDQFQKPADYHAGEEGSEPAEDKIRFQPPETPDPAEIESVLIVDDIIDTGSTVGAMMSSLEEWAGEQLEIEIACPLVIEEADESGNEQDFELPEFPSPEG